MNTPDIRAVKRRPSVQSMRRRYSGDSVVETHDAFLRRQSLQEKEARRRMALDRLRLQRPEWFCGGPFEEFLRRLARARSNDRVAFLRTWATDRIAAGDRVTATSCRAFLQDIGAIEEASEAPAPARSVHEEAARDRDGGSAEAPSAAPAAPAAPSAPSLSQEAENLWEDAIQQLVGPDGILEESSASEAGESTGDEFDAAMLTSSFTSDSASRASDAETDCESPGSADALETPVGKPVEGPPTVTPAQESIVVVGPELDGSAAQAAAPGVSLAKLPLMERLAAVSDATDRLTAAASERAFPRVAPAVAGSFTACFMYCLSAAALLDAAVFAGGSFALFAILSVCCTALAARSLFSGAGAPAHVSSTPWTAFAMLMFVAVLIRLQHLTAAAEVGASPGAPALKAPAPAPGGVLVGSTITLNADGLWEPAWLTSNGIQPMATADGGACAPPTARNRRFPVVNRAFRRVRAFAAAAEAQALHLDAAGSQPGRRGRRRRASAAIADGVSACMAEAEVEATGEARREQRAATALPVSSRRSGAQEDDGGASSASRTRIIGGAVAIHSVLCLARSFA